MKSETARKLVSVVFTDIEGYSALTQKDEALALSYVSKYRECVIKHTSANHGEVIHFYGDGSLTIHDSAIHAVKCAIGMQKDLRSGPVIPVRIGIHLGEVVRKDETIYGNAVNIASRVQDLAAAGSILVTESISEQLSNHSDIQLNYVGKERVKNIANPIKVFAVESEGLVVPSHGEIHRRNKARKPASVLAIIAIILLSAVLIFSDFLPNLSLLPRHVRDQRVVVQPFDNLTGDPSLDFISNIVTRHISRSLEEVESAKVVNYDGLLRTNQYQRFGLIPLQKAMKEVRAENIIEGNYAFTNDSTLKFTSALRDGSTWEYIVHFPDVSSGMNTYDQAIEELGQRISGYWQSKDAVRLSIPLQDADNAFNEALRYWKSDYPRAIYYLKKAILIDSTFMDAYYYLSDAYSNQWDYDINQWDYRRADSVLQDIEVKFNIEEFTERQLRNYHLYQAIINGQSEKAFKLLREQYEKDSDEIFTNTAMSIFALQYVNEPELCLEVLHHIPFDSIDFEANDHYLDRITMAAQASITLGRYQDALNYANYYPSDDKYPNHFEVKARALAGLGDTASINRLLQLLNVKLHHNVYGFVLYGLSKDFRIFGDEDMGREYSRRALAAYKNRPSITRGNLMLDNGQIDQGLEYFKSRAKLHPESQPTLLGLARALALSGQRDTANQIIVKMQELRPDRFDMGATYYRQCKVYTYMGEYDEAIVKLGQAIDDGFLFTFRVVQNDPDLMPLFDMPEFQKLLHPLAD